MPSDCVELFNTVNPVIDVADNVPLTCKSSEIVTAEESVDEITLVSIISVSYTHLTLPRICSV